MVQNHTCWDASSTVALPKPRQSSRWTGTSCFVMRPSMCDFVPYACDRVVQMNFLDQKVENKGRKLKLTEVRNDEIKCRS